MFVFEDTGMSHISKDSFRKIPRAARIGITVFAVLTILAVIVSIYKLSKNHLLDRTEYKACVSDIREASASFSSNEDMKNCITDWADSCKLEYTADDAGNIIFEKKASKTKKNIAPIIIAVSCNWRTASENAESLATAEMIAKSDFDSGSYSVIFFNDSMGCGNGYRNISEDYLPDKSKVVYLDTGDNPYISVNSFAYAPNSISIPCEMVPVSCDSAVKIKISGIQGAYVDSHIGSIPNPLSALGPILSKLSNKSITYQLADVKVQSTGRMCPEGMEATVLLNSYSLPTLTSYLDERAKKYEKSYKKDFPEISYTYEIIEDTSDFPVQAYSDESVKSLNSILYTVVDGTYKFDKEDVPEGNDVDEVYAINSISNLNRRDGKLTISLDTYAMDKSYLKQVLSDNSTAADFAGAEPSNGNIVPGLKNNSSKLHHELQFAYVKVNSSSTIIIKEDCDYAFVPCSILSQINDNIDIVHLREDSSNAATYTNTLLCFIKDQANFLSL